ncbi:MAG: hypothetical protein HC800_00945 [Phormidesmis sp. RL_2_1]|nr:hypothetical protein [Phormidesmis sp. RL_2_1]
MNIRLERSLFLPQVGLKKCVAYCQSILMRAAVAISLKLCLFTAKVLLNTARPVDQRASQSY